MILVLDIAVTFAIIYFLGNFFAKLFAEKILKRPLSQTAKTILMVVYLIVAVLCFLPSILNR